MSVGDEKEAQALIIAGCPRDDAGNFYARELVNEQTLENLEVFSKKLQTIHDKYFKGTERCRCKPIPAPKRRNKSKLMEIKNAKT